MNMILPEDANVKIDNKVIFDVTSQNFETEVMATSKTTPILIDFWAPWCGPCKQLMPVLEKLVNAAGGKVKLAKVNIDDEPALAQAFQVQSVPTVIAVFQEQPVTGFQGVQPESQIKAVIDQLAKLGESVESDTPTINIEELLASAQEALQTQNFDEAKDCFGQILEAEENNVHAYVGLIRAMIETGEKDYAFHLIERVSDEIAKAPEFQSVKKFFEATNQSTDDLKDLEATLETSTENHELRFTYAEKLFAAGKYENAFDQLILIIGKDRAWEDDKARKQLLSYFEFLGHSDPLTASGRKKLSRVLFS